MRRRPPFGTELLAKNDSWNIRCGTQLPWSYSWRSPGRSPLAAGAFRLQAGGPGLFAAQLGAFMITSDPDYWDLTAVGGDRAIRLGNTAVESILEQFTSSVMLAAQDAAEMRLGWEGAGENSAHHRAVVQIHVSDEHFDQFMNGRAGYRARYLIGASAGDDLNKDLVTAVVRVISPTLGPTCQVRLLDPDFRDLGPVFVERETFLRSLVPQLSKVWHCARLINVKSGITDIPVGVGDPRIGVSNSKTWPTISRDAGKAWLDVKGAFLGAEGPYQPKSMVKRSIGLNIDGLA